MVKIAAAALLVACTAASAQTARERVLEIREQVLVIQQRQLDEERRRIEEQRQQSQVETAVAERQLRSLEDAKAVMRQQTAFVTQMLVTSGEAALAREKVQNARTAELEQRLAEEIRRRSELETTAAEVRRRTLAAQEQNLFNKMMEQK